MSWLKRCYQTYCSKRMLRKGGFKSCHFHQKNPVVGKQACIHPHPPCTNGILSLTRISLTYAPHPLISKADLHTKGHLIKNSQLHIWPMGYMTRMKINEQTSSINAKYSFQRQRTKLHNRSCPRPARVHRAEYIQETIKKYN